MFLERCLGGGNWKDSESSVAEVMAEAEVVAESSSGTMRRPGFATGVSMCRPEGGPLRRGFASAWGPERGAAARIGAGMLIYIF